MALRSAPVPPQEGRFTLEASDGGAVLAHLQGRRVGTLLITDRLVVEPSGDAAGARLAFARAFADACRPVKGETLVVEGPALESWSEALLEAGFRLATRKACVDRRLDDALPACPSDWSERSLADVGETAFLARLVAVSEGDPFEDRRAGPRDVAGEWRALVGHAGARFDATRWWLVDDVHGPLGVLLPQPLNAAKGTLSYLGLLPQRRGRGLGTALHALGLHRLRERGCTLYTGSTDVRNAAMRAVFARNGCPVTGHDALYNLGP